MDESDARRVAAVYGLRMTGTIGILLRAKREGRLRVLREDLDRLRADGAFWVHDDVYRSALRAAGEQP